MSAAPDPLSVLVRDVQARWGTRALQRGVTRSPLTSGTTLATGSPELDTLLPAGGLPRGALSVTAGPLTSGKTTLALRVTATAQAAGEQVLWFDLAHTFDPHAAVHWQVSLPDLVLVRPQEATEALEILADVLRAAASGLVVLSLPLAGWPKDAPLLSRALQRMRAPLAASQAVLLALAPPDPPWAAQAALQLRMQEKAWWVEQGELKGYRVTVGVERGSVMLEVPL